MKLPFTAESFFGIFSEYNNTVWPVQIIFFLAALLTVIVLYKKMGQYYKAIPAFLGFLWLWMGVVYHLYFFSKINPAAKIFGILFIVEGLLLIFAGLVKKRLLFGNSNKINTITSYLLISYALIIYPLITIATGHSYPAMPTFGLPCPTTIFTLAVLLQADLKKLPKYLLFIPIIWTLVGTSAAVSLGVVADTMLIITSLAFIVLFIRSTKNQQIS